jgi:hypothetical protein
LLRYLHFAFVSASWLNLMERWFAELTTRKLRRSAYRSGDRPRDRHLQVDHRMEQGPRLFVCAKTADEIPGALAAYCRRINDSGH